LPGRANTNVPDAVSTALPERSKTCCSKCALAVFVAALKARKSSRPFARASVKTASSRRLLNEDLAIAVGRHRRDQPRALHVFDEARGAVVADAKVALHEGDRGTAVLQDDLDGLVVEGIGFS